MAEQKMLLFCKNVGVSVEEHEKEILRILMEIEERRDSSLVTQFNQ